MNDVDTRRLRGRIIEDIPRDPDQLAEFARAFSDVLGQPIFPSSLRVQAQDIVKFRPESVVKVGVQQRMVVPAMMHRHPVIISHRFPMRPPLTQKLLVFSDVDLFDHLDLAVGKPVSILVERRHIGRAHILDWARSIGNVLDGGIGK